MKSTRTLLSAALVLAMIALGACQVTPTSKSCDNRKNDTIDKLLKCVTLNGVREHQAAFQQIADDNGGNRSAGTSGYDASVDYVVAQMEAAGYNVSLHDVPHPYFEELSPAVLEQFAPVPTVYQYNSPAGFITANHSGSGDVTAVPQGVDLALGTPSWPSAPSTSTSGCEAGDFAGFTPGNIALIQRGVCAFSTKVQNAEAAGAAGVVIANQGNSPERVPAFLLSLGGPGVTIPVVSANFNVLVALSEATSVRVAVDAISEIRNSPNVIAETPGGDPDNVVMVGGHLDSVKAGPGVNDNGSGSAALLETAIQMKNVNPVNKVRFAWWGAEEFGLLGSFEYVANLPDADLAKIRLYLNFDMIGSPNYYFGVYDGDESTFDQIDGFVPAGSADIEQTFEDYYDLVGLPYEDTAFSGRSDYRAFIEVGIPSGGLFTGAEDLKSPEQVARYGGTAGVQADPCYHQACDTFDNVNLFALERNSDSVAYSTLTYALSTALPG